MITLQSADNALKQVYLEVVSNQLNTNANPLLAKIEQTTRDVWGKEIVKVAFESDNVIVEKTIVLK